MTEIKNMMNIDFLGGINPASDEAVRRYEQEQREEALKIERARLEENYKKYSGVPSRYLTESLETYKPTAENQKIYDWILGFVNSVKAGKNTTNIICLLGKFGTGKTHLGCGIIRQLGGKILTSLELCITYDSCRDFKSDMTRIQYLHKLCESPVLVIDEVGKGIGNIEKEILPYIVNDFYGSGRILIFLTNESRETFNKIIGEAAIDRMNEIGVYFSLIGESNRKRK